MSGLFEQSGARPQKEPKEVPLFIDRAFTGIYKQRSVLHDPSGVVETKYYGGRPDALWDGVNVELTNRLTLQRRPGLSTFSDATYPTPPNRSFSFELLDGTIQIIIDTDTTGTLSVIAVTASCGSTAIYSGTFPDGGSDAYVGLLFDITGFLSGTNNGQFVCVGSTTTTLTLENSLAVSEGPITASTISAGVVYYDHQSGGLKTLLFAKKPGAGETRFVSVAGVMYAGDGVDTWKYTPGNPNGTVWNFGIVAPTAPPIVTVVSAGAAAVAWQASTWFSTMGILVDSNGNAQQLIGVNNDGSNPSSQFGTSSIGGPPWNHTVGGTTADGTVTWRNIGTLLPFQASTIYSNFEFNRDTGTAISSCLFDTPTQTIYVCNGFGNLETSSSTHPPFTGVPGSGADKGDGDATFKCIGPIAGNIEWHPGEVITSIYTFAVEYPNPPAPNQTAYFHEVTATGGTTNASFANPHWSTNVGGFTPDKQLLWVNLGSATWSALTSYKAWVNSTRTDFSCVEDTNGNLQVCIQSGSSGALEPTNWGSAYGSTTTDGSVIWVCIGSSSSWASNAIFYLPKDGFSVPSSSNPFGGASVKDTNSNIQFVVDTGFSQTPGPPSWLTNVGDLTADNTIVWYNNGPFIAKSFSWTQGHQYVFAYKARTATDLANTETPPLWSNPLGTPLGSETGAVSSASPAFIITGSNAGAVVTISGPGSTDPQVDTIEIYRTADGGSTFLFLTDIPNPSTVAGVAGTWTVQDFMPDTPTATLPGLDPEIQAAINGVNNPPPSNFIPMVYNFQRIWGASGSSVIWSGGPDTLVGNPNEAFSVSDEFTFLATVTRLVKTSQGLITFLTNSIEIIAGGPLTSSFYSVTLASSIGLLHYDALDTYAGEIYFFSSDAQFKTLSPALALSNSGFPLGEQFAAWDGTKVRVAVLQSGIDSCIFVADGTTGWYRVNPRQIPGGPQGLEPVWSPFAAITNGCHMVQSVETIPGIKKLLVGSALANQKILKRDLSVFTDNGASYPANFVMGSITLAHPGQIAGLRFIEADFSGVSYQPTISFLLNEISGTFTNFTAAPQFDPPSIYGKTITPGSYSPNRYYFAGTRAAARCRHLQIQVDFGTNATGSEMYNLTIFGRLFTE
jgi:hypothetical protein